MIEERRQDIREHLEYPDDEDPHDNPFPDLFSQGVFHNPPEQQAENGNNDRHNDGGPEHEAFAESMYFNHIMESIIILFLLQTLLRIPEHYMLPSLPIFYDKYHRNSLVLSIRPYDG